MEFLYQEGVSCGLVTQEAGLTKIMLLLRSIIFQD
jgi:hypothetical protein